MNLSFLNPVRRCCCCCCLPIQRYRRFRGVAPTGRRAPVRDLLTRLSGIMLCKWKAGWLSWPGCQWNGSVYISSFTCDGLHWRNEGLLAGREREQVHDTLLFPIHPAHASHSHIRLHWSEGWDGGHTHTYHSNFISWYTTWQQGHAVCAERLWLTKRHSYQDWANSIIGNSRTWDIL